MCCSNSASEETNGFGEDFGPICRVMIKRAASPTRGMGRRILRRIEGVVKIPCDCEVHRALATVLLANHGEGASVDAWAEASFRIRSQSGSWGSFSEGSFFRTVFSLMLIVIVTPESSGGCRKKGAKVTFCPLFQSVGKLISRITYPSARGSLRADGDGWGGASCGGPWPRSDGYVRG